MTTKINFDNSGVASLHNVAGHNLGLLIWLDSRGTMEYVHQKRTIHYWDTFIEDFMHFVSNVVIIIHIIHL